VIYKLASQKTLKTHFLHYVTAGPNRNQLLVS